MAETEKKEKEREIRATYSHTDSTKASTAVQENKTAGNTNAINIYLLILFLS